MASQSLAVYYIIPFPFQPISSSLLPYQQLVGSCHGHRLGGGGGALKGTVISSTACYVYGKTQKAIYHLKPWQLPTNIYIQLLPPHIYHHLLCAACNQHNLYKTCGSYMVCPLCKLHWLLHQALPMVPVHALVLIWSVVAVVVVACCWCVTLQLVLMLVLTFSNFWRCIYNSCQL